MTDPFLGEIKMFSGDFVPRGWAACDGQTLAITQHSELFALIGTTYGGNGTDTFALPDMRGRTPVHYGTGSGLTNRNIGDTFGTETHQLIEAEMPSHTHTIKASDTGSDQYPDGKFIEQQYFNVIEPDSDSGATVSSVGGDTAHENMQPYLVVNYIFALHGIYPTG